MSVFGLVRGLLDWWSELDALDEIGNSELFRMYVWPVVSAVATAAGGIAGRQAVMWIIMASALAFAAAMQARVSADILREKRTPQNKLTYQVVFQCDLDRVQAPLLGNRQQRRGQLAQENTYLLGAAQVHPEVKRHIEKAQIGIELTNNSGFPISCILVSATTDIQGATPPRSTFPKQAATVLAWSKIRLLDDIIDMENLPCQKLIGNMNLVVKYGRPGKEKFELTTKGAIEIAMVESGLVQSIFLSLVDPPPAPRTIQELLR
jgi:hypothetical protein